MNRFPEFLLEDDRGERHAFPGAKPALVCFVKDDCPTCHAVAPLLEAAYRELSEDVNFFVCGQTEEGNRALAEKHGLTVPILDDSSLKVSFAWNVEIVPTLYLFHEGGKANADTSPPQAPDGDAAAGAASTHAENTPHQHCIGFAREEWRRALNDLATVANRGEPNIDWSAYPELRPGCGSLSADPTVATRLQAESENSPLRARRIDIATHDDEFEFMFDQGFSDGMPLVPPTPERVMRMLAGTARDPQEVIATVAPNMGEATVEKVAINAVMAGCKPEYLPVVLTAIEAACTDEFNIHGVMATTMGASPVMVVNGPIRHRLGMNMKLGALGQGNRANATIGRALRLAIRNIGGAKPGGTERSTLGNPMKFSMCFPEWEERSPWTPLHVERGFDANDSVLTLFAMTSGPTLMVDQDSRSASQLAGSLGLCLETMFHPKAHMSGEALMVVCPEHVDTFARDGYGKADIRARMQEVTQRPIRDLVEDETAGPGFKREMAARMDEDALNRKLPKFRDGNDIHLVVAGAEAGKFTGAFHGWVTGETGSIPVSRKIE